MLPIENFNVDAFLDCANALVNADEVERALWLLTDGLPGYYRDNPPSAVLELKDEILKRTATATKYAHSVNDMYPDDCDYMDGLLRGRAAIAEADLCKRNGQRPLIIDYGPGSYWVEKTLKRKGYEFTYAPVSFDRSPLHGACNHSPKIFFAFEIIEHLWDETELKIEAMRYGLPDVVHISTPLYTYDFSDVDWRKDRECLGHLRTYTPAELQMIAMKLFPEYQYTFYKDQIMHMRLALRTTQFEFLKTNLQLKL